MLRLIITLFFIVHGLIHLMGFARGFNLARIQVLSKDISKANGIIWLNAAILFWASAIAFILETDKWWMAAATALLFSQYAIITSWRDARYGSLANGIILLVTIAGYGTWHFRHTYQNEVSTCLRAFPPEETHLLAEADIADLPYPVQKYIRYTGCMGKPIVTNFKVAFKGHIRKNAASEWMDFTSEQYNFMQEATRLFYLKAVMMYLPVEGFHRFVNGNASMDIRLFSLFPVQYQSGPEMDTAETVTYFNDMCVVAPATLIDKRIQWIETDSNTVKAVFTQKGIRISAWLYFNQKGEMINFISDNRYATTEDNSMKKFRWSTPMKNYKEINGYKLASYAETIYTYPEGDFCYGNFTLTGVEYNCTQYK